MFQKIFAIFLILYLLFRLYGKKRAKLISTFEFYLWLFICLLGLAGIFFLTQIDVLVAKIGFSSSGIDVLAYLGIALIFYFVFKLRIKIEKIENEITKIVREVSIINSKKQ